MILQSKRNFRRAKHEGRNVTDPHGSNAYNKLQDRTPTYFEKLIIGLMEYINWVLINIMKKISFKYFFIVPTNNFSEGLRGAINR